MMMLNNMHNAFMINGANVNDYNKFYTFLKSQPKDANPTVSLNEWNNNNPDQLVYYDIYRISNFERPNKTDDCLDHIETEMAAISVACLPINRQKHLSECEHCAIAITVAASEQNKKNWYTFIFNLFK